MKKLCDLHTHSTYSDGTFAPREIIERSAEIGLSAVALCDHNTIEGAPEFLSAASEYPIEAIAGAEFSVDLNGKELHLLGLFVPQRFFSQVTDLMVEVNERKERSNIDLILALNKNGISIDYDKIKSGTQNGWVNRAHIAAELTRKGYTDSIAHAFKTLLSPSAGFYKEPERITVWEMIDFIESIQAVPVLAHPFLNLSEKELVDFLPLAKRRGLKGMECQYSLYDADTTRRSVDLATRFDLKLSGGSDFHGAIKPGIELGVGKGNLEIPYEWAVALKAENSLEF